MHRLLIIIHAGPIMMGTDRRIVEDDTHAELAEAGDAYLEMHAVIASFSSWYSKERKKGQ